VDDVRPPVGQQAGQGSEGAPVGLRPHVADEVGALDQPGAGVFGQAARVFGRRGAGPGDERDGQARRREPPAESTSDVRRAAPFEPGDDLCDVKASCDQGPAATVFAIVSAACSTRATGSRG
jgi:hypothetical protein